MTDQRGVIGCPACETGGPHPCECGHSMDQHELDDVDPEPCEECPCGDYEPVWPEDGKSYPEGEPNCTVRLINPASQCAHPDSVFSRSICPEPCGMMHTYCATCGDCLDACPLERAEDAESDCYDAVTLERVRQADEDVAAGRVVSPEAIQATLAERRKREAGRHDGGYAQAAYQWDAVYDAATEASRDQLADLVTALLCGHQPRQVEALVIYDCPVHSPALNPDASISQAMRLGSKDPEYRNCPTCRHEPSLSCTGWICCGWPCRTIELIAKCLEVTL